MSDNHIKATEVLAEAIFSVWREKNLAGLLAALITVVSLIFLWPLMDFYAVFFENFSLTNPMNEAEMTQLFEESFGPGTLTYILILSIPMVFIQYGALVLWTRAVVLGRNRAFEGGFKLLFKRALWALWRYICVIGWMLLLMVGFWVIIFVITFLFGAMGASSSANGTIIMAALLLIPLYIGFLLIVMGLTFLMSFAIHGEARDFHIPIHQAYKYLKGNLLKPTGLLFLLMMAFYMVLIFLMLLVFPLMQEGAGFGIIIAMGLMSILGMVFNLVWISFGAVYASKLVPELQK